MLLVMLTPSAAAAATASTTSTSTSSLRAATTSSMTNSTHTGSCDYNSYAHTGGSTFVSADGYMCTVCGYSVLLSHPQLLIECHYCAQWFHRACVHISDRDATQLVKYACGACSGKQSGASAFLVDFRYPGVKAGVAMDVTTSSSNQPHSSDGAAANLYQKSSESFRRVLKSDFYAKSGVRVLQPQDFAPAYFKVHPPSCEDPILVDGNNWGVAHLREPLPVIRASEITALLARNCAMRALDVAAQESFNLSPSGWSARLAAAKTTPVNAQFRVQDTHLYSRVAAPVAVAKVDWHFALPRNNHSNVGGSSPQPTSSSSSPVSAANALMNPDTFGNYFGAGSFQDFAVNRGGKCAWLSVSSGAAWVFLIPPTHENLRSFEHWRRAAEPAPARVFLAERADQCIRCIVSAGSTLFIPSGWVYAVYADEDCSFFSGFFGMTASLFGQLRVLEMEANEYMAQCIAQTSLAAGWQLTDAAPQVWAAVCFYVRQYLLPDAGVVVGEPDKHALVRALPYLRRWSATPKALKSNTSTGWLPSSLAEAHGILDRLEQALSNELGVTPLRTPFDMRTQRYGPATYPMMGGASALAREQQQQQLHNLSVSEADYLYARGDMATDPAMSWSMTDSSGNSAVQPMSGFQDVQAMWSYGSPEQQQQHASLGGGFYPSSLESEFASHVATDFTFSLPPHGASAFAVAPHALGGASNDTYMDAMRQQLLGPTLVAPTAGLSSHEHQQHQQHQSQHFGAASSTGSSNNTVGGGGGAASNLFGAALAAQDGLVRHRASCHRCGNLRKKNVRCPQCPHIFCQKCAEKMLEEHGDGIFTDGCPVCKEQCCCGKNRTMLCTRKFHCYKKCPSTKKPPV